MDFYRVLTLTLLPGNIYIVFYLYHFFQGSCFYVVMKPLYFWLQSIKSFITLFLYRKYVFTWLSD